jgi:DNA polymerase III sliding clamp (beta) subunit (PCNA family)
VLVETQGDSSVALTCTDLDRRASAIVPATVTEPGAIAIDATRLLKLVTALPDTQALTVVADDGSPIAKVSSGRSRYQFEQLNVRDFPQRFEPRPDATQIELSQDQIAHLVAKTRFCDLGRRNEILSVRRFRPHDRRSGRSVGCLRHRRLRPGAGVHRLPAEGSQGRHRPA